MIWNAASTTGERRALAIAVLLCLGGATGCKNFFTPVNGTATGGGTTTDGGNYAYVISSNTSGTTAINTISGFSIGTASLTKLSGFPLGLQIAPTAIAISPTNPLIYVAGTGAAGTGVLSGFTISTAGALTSILSSTSSTALVNANIVSMDISPDGKWLLALDAIATIPTIDIYQITATTGQLTVESSVEYPFQGTATLLPTSLHIAPTGNYVAASLGTGGDVLFGFDTSTGTLTALTQVNTGSASAADQAVLFDASGTTIYIARSGTGGGIYPYAVSASGLSSTPVAGAPFATGSGTSSLELDSTGKYLYAGNRTDGTISAFTIGTTGVLMPISGSPYSAGGGVNTLGRDNSDKYILATAGGGSPDLEMFSFDATVGGKLDTSTTAATGNPTEPAGAVGIALTH